MKTARPRKAARGWMPRLRPALWLAGLVLLAATGIGESAPTPLLESETFVLDNGMRFVLVQRPRAASVAAGWVTTSGSAADPEGRSGTAHMLEHMMFKGTDRIQAGEIDLLYAEAGASGLNAVTQRDSTSYFVSIPREKLELWFWLESDRLLAPAFRALNAERQVVEEERRLRVDSSPTGELEERLLRELWGDHPYAHPISGEPAQLDKLSTGDVRTFFEAHYRPSKLTAVLVGDLDRALVEEWAERYFGRLPAGPPSDGASAAAALEAPGKLESTLFEAACACRTQSRVLYRTVPYAHADAPTIELLVSVLNGRSGRLHRSLVLDQGIAFAAFASYEGLHSGGALSLTAEARDGVEAQALLAALDREIESLGTEPPGEEELERARNRLRADAIRGIEEPSELMLRLLVQAGLGDLDRLDRWSVQLSAVSSEDIARIVEETLTQRPRVVGLFDRSGEEVSPR